MTWEHAKYSLVVSKILPIIWSSFEITQNSSLYQYVVIFGGDTVQIFYYIALQDLVVFSEMCY